MLQNFWCVIIGWNITFQGMGYRCCALDLANFMFARNNCNDGHICPGNDGYFRRTDLKNNVREDTNHASNAHEPSDFEKIREAWEMLQNSLCGIRAWKITFQGMGYRCCEA